jgi:alpha-1,2-glucosyltransferase
MLFAVEHPYNLIVTDYSLRNGLLKLVSEQRVAWIVLGVLATLGLCGLGFSRVWRPPLWFVLPLSLLFVAGSWMIETRYAIVPLALLLAVRRPQSEPVEWLTLAGWIACRSG